MAQSLVFTYNADNTLWGNISDFTHKIISPATYTCNLCRLTYDAFQMKSKWKDFISTLPYKIIFFHKDEFQKNYPDLRTISFPAVFVQDSENNLLPLLTANEINRCQTLEDLITTLNNALNTQSSK